MTIDLVFDTETTGLARLADPITDQEQPFVLQLAALLVEDDKVLDEINVLFNWPEVKEIPKEAFDVHHIDLKTCRKEGVKPLTILKEFDALVRRADFLVAHNMEFDDFILRTAYHRVGGTGQAFSRRPRICTMQSARSVLELPPKKPPPEGAKPRYKLPSLVEAYKLLVDENGFEGAHNALADTRACHGVLVALRRRKVTLSYKAPQRKRHSASVDVDRAWLDDLLTQAEEHESRLTEWERAFAADFSERSAQYGDNLFVSAKQRAILVRIEGKINAY